MKNTNKVFLLGLLLSLLAMLSACASLRQKIQAKVITRGGTEFEQKGDSKSAPIVSTGSGNMEIQVPKGSKVTMTSNAETKDEKVVVELADNSRLNYKTVSENIKGAEGYAPPTPSEIAKGKAVEWFFIAGGIFLIAGLALVYFQHYKAAGFSFAASFLVPVAGQLFSSDIALKLGIGLGVASFVLFGAWFLISRKFDLFPKAKR